jgi:hypothetical protein
MARYARRVVCQLYQRNTRFMPDIIPKIVHPPNLLHPQRQFPGSPIGLQAIPWPWSKPLPGQSPAIG